MTALAAPSTAEPGALLAEYVEHVATLGLGDSAIEQRRHHARSLLEAHGDLVSWMGRPLRDRLVDLKRTKSWSFVVWAVLTGRVAPDLDLLVARHLGGMHGLAEALFADGFAEVRTAAGRLGWDERWVNHVLVVPLTVAVAWTGRSPCQLTDADLDALKAGIKASAVITADRRTRLVRDVGRLHRVLYEARLVDRPHSRARGPRRDPLHGVTAPEVRRVIGAYLDARRPVLRPGSVEGITNDLACFGELLAEHHPQVCSLAQLERAHVEQFCQWAATRPRRKGSGTVSASAAAHNVITLRNFLDDISEWGWAEAPSRRLMFAGDVPRQPEPLPRALAPDIDAAVMAAVANLDDHVARAGLTIIRATGVRAGELVDLELDCVVDYGAHGSWLRVPLGKLATERTVPLDDATLEVLDHWTARRGVQRSIPHPRHGRPTDFLFVEHGHPVHTGRLRGGLAAAVAAAGLTGPDGAPLRVVPHQLRHTYATELANAGMSLQALMALLGHASPQMTLRYARLASPAVKAAYDQAAGKLARRFPVAPAGRQAFPGREAWLQSEMLKTRVAHGYCSRDLVAEACPYANICEQCDNFATGVQFLPALESQLADVTDLRDDSQQRGWSSEAARHERVIASLDRHLRRLKNSS